MVFNDVYYYSRILEQMIMSDPNEHTRILWACRRGMLELDLLLQPFAKSIYVSLSPDDKVTFQRLLALDDPILYRWLMGKDAADDPDLQRMVDRIRNK